MHFNVIAPKLDWVGIGISQQSVDNRLCGVHIGEAIAKLIDFGLRQFDTAFAFDSAAVTSTSAWLQVRKNPVQQLTLKHFVSRRGQSKGARRCIAIQPLSLGHLAHHVFDLVSHLLKGTHVLRLRELSQLLHIDDPDLRCLGRFLKLLEQLVDRLQLLLDLQRLRNGHPLVADEQIVGRELINLVLVTQAIDDMHKLPSKAIRVVIDLVVDTLQQINLMMLDRLIVNTFQTFRRLSSLGVLVVDLVGLLLDRMRFVGFQNLAFAFLEHHPQMIDAWTKASDLTWI